MDLWNATSNFENVCNLLNDPTKRMHEIAITLFSPCRPMLGDKAKPNNIQNLMGGSEFYIETKYDGERFQLHKSLNKYSYFSRNSNDYTESFGSSNSNGIYTQYIHDCFLDDVNSVILDGEMCVYSNDDKILLTKSDSYDVKSMDRRTFETDVQVCFCVFDILLYNDEVLTNKPLKERLEYLNKTFEEREGHLIISPRQTCKTNQEAIDALNKAIDARLGKI
jgi:DNA ligase-4